MFDNPALAFLHIGTAFYVLGFAYAFAAATRGREHDRPVFYACIIAAFVAQSAGLYMRGLETHSLPVGNAFELVQALAWVAVFLQLILRSTLRLRLLGLFASGLAAGLGVGSLFLPSAHAQAAGVVDTGNPWIEFHVALAVFSYGVFGLLAVTALMYLLQRYGLERKLAEGIFRLLPSLAELDALNQKLLLVGAWALSIAVALGVLVWIEQPGGVGAIKLVVTIGVWVGYLVVAILRWRNQLAPRSYAWSCVLLFALAIFSLWSVSREHHDNATVAPPPASAPTTKVSST
ncbi:MAG TPA: cytochrome c biogenesis protein CcsA [Opitutales bacterium]|jgi:HemX protein|nr:cytochrome c biogenesis protein CcsA [Opitutales bacterium]